MTDRNEKQALEDKLKENARYLHISIPYDKDEDAGLITFDDGLMTELECDDNFTPPIGFFHLCAALRKPI